MAARPVAASARGRRMPRSVPQPGPCTYTRPAQRYRAGARSGRDAPPVLRRIPGYDRTGPPQSSGFAGTCASRTTPRSRPPAHGRTGWSCSTCTRPRRKATGPRAPRAAGGCTGASHGSTRACASVAPDCTCATAHRSRRFSRPRARPVPTACTGIVLYEPALAARDEQVASGLRAAGLAAESCNAAMLVEPWEVSTREGGAYRVFTPYWRACAARLEEQPRPLPAPRIASAPVAEPAPSLDELGLCPRIPWDAGLDEAWTPGEAGAHARLDDFCETVLGGYAQSRDRPDQDGTSRLSPHLHYGEIGPRQCVAAARNALAGRARPPVRLRRVRAPARLA